MEMVGIALGAASIEITRMEITSKIIRAFKAFYKNINMKTSGLTAHQKLRENTTVAYGEAPPNL
eukprot:472560-Pyramimonas_sp.AAC.1